MNIEYLGRDTWPAGRLLAFSGLDGPTDYKLGLVARTAAGPSLEIKWPAGCKFNFPHFKPGSFLVGGDFFELRNAAHLLRGAFIDTHHLLLEGPCEILETHATIAHHREGQRVLTAPAHLLDQSKISRNLDQLLKERVAWLNAQPIPSSLPTLTRRALACAYTIMKTQVYTPEGNIRCRWTTPDRWPHRNMWLWDSVFHAIGWRHLDVSLAKDAITAVVQSGREDGFIPIMITPDKISDSTQPPLLAFGARMVHELRPDLAWIERLYPRLGAYVEWDLKNRDSDGAGLVEWHINGNVNCRSGESGMDNSPRFDSATHLDAVDFNAFLALECESLASFARELGKRKEAEKWSQLHQRLCQLINRRLWNESAEFYLDYDMDQQAPSPVLAGSGFLPLICGAPSREQAEKLVRHLHDPATFGTPLPVATVAAKCHSYYAKDMWRGPVWVNFNWLIAHGLDRYGLQSEADALRDSTCREIERCFDKYGTFFEFFDDRMEVDPPRLMRKGQCAPEKSPFHQVFHDYGWTATLYVDMRLGQLRQKGY